MISKRMRGTYIADHALASAAVRNIWIALPASGCAIARSSFAARVALAHRSLELATGAARNHLLARGARLPARVRRRLRARSPTRSRRARSPARARRTRGTQSPALRRPS
jgi:hypothetical protein